MVELRGRHGDDDVAGLGLLRLQTESETLAAELTTHHTNSLAFRRQLSETLSEREGTYRSPHRDGN